MEKVAYTIARVIAVGILVGGLSILGQGVIDIGNVLDYERYSTAEKVTQSMIVVGGMLVIGGGMLAVVYGLWNVKKIAQWW